MASPRQTTVILLLFALLTLGVFGASVLSQRRATRVVSRQPTVLASDPSRGPAAALVTIVEFGDFECPACAAMMPVMNDILERYPTQVRHVWKDLPTTDHPQAVAAAMAARCGADQGKFWEFADALFAHQSELNTQLYLSLARELGLDTERFLECQADAQTRALVDRAQREGLALGVSSLPTLFVNDQRLSGVTDPETLKQLIDAEVGGS